MPVRILLILMALTLTAHQAVAQHHGTATTGQFQRNTVPKAGRRLRRTLLASMKEC